MDWVLPVRIGIPVPINRDVARILLQNVGMAAYVPFNLGATVARAFTSHAGKMYGGGKKKYKGRNESEEI